MTFGAGFGFPRARFPMGAAPTLSMDFAGTAALPPYVTFSRGTNATYVDSLGNIAYAPSNLLTYSEQFDNTAWVKNGATVTANSTVAPDGTYTADAVIESATTSTHSPSRVVTISAGAPLSISVYVKQQLVGAERQIRLQMGSVNGFRAYFDLSAGLVALQAQGFGTGTAAVNSGVIAPIGDGWYRCSVQGTCGPIDTSVDTAFFMQNTTTGSASYTGDGVSGLYIWGAQLNLGTLQPYNSTTVKNLLGYTQDFDNAAWTKSNSFIQTNLLTYSEQFDNAAWSKFGIAVQTNQIRNNTMQGAVAPSTFPTNWQNVTVAGLTTTVIGSGVVDGITYLDVRVNGTPAISTYYNLVPDILVAAASGQTWTGSFWASLVAGSLTNTNANIEIRESDAAQAFLANSIALLPLTSTLTRYSQTKALNNAATAFVSVRFVWQVTISAPVDFTLRIGLPQLVIGAAPGDVVRTYGTAMPVMYQSPVNTSAADKIIETFTNGQHLVQTITPTSAVVGVSYTLSAYAKAGERSELAFTSFGEPTAVFDLLTGTVSVTGGLVCSITDAGGGWYRCSATFVKANVNGWYYIGLWQSGSYTYPGNGISGLYVWGAQVVQGATPGDYQATTTAALAVQYRAPDGSLTADKLVEDTANSTHYVRQTPTGTVNTSPMTLTVYAKAGERSNIMLALQEGSPFTRQTNATFNLLGGTVSAISELGGASASSSSITPIGNGWFRCRLTTTLGGAANSVLSWVYARTEALLSYTGDGTSGVYIWGAQLSDSASLDPYSYNFTTAPTAAAYYGPRFDYDPVTLACKGLLIEEQRTNSIRNNTMQGAVAGTPGTAPTNWSIGGAAGLTTTIVGTGVESGISYIDIRLSGTTTGTFASIVFDSLSGLTTATSYALSTFLKIVAGSAANIGTPALITRYNLSPSGSVDISTAFNLATLVTPLNTNRISGVGTTAGTLTGTGICFILLNWLNGTAVDITLRIGLPQLELGAFATSVIPTTTAAVTRAADVAVIQGANFSNWYNQSEGTLYAEFVNGIQGSASATGQSPGVWAVADSSLGGTFNGYGLRLALVSSSASAIQFSGRSGATIANAQPIPFGYLNAGATYKTASAWNAGNIIFAISGVAGASATNTVASLLTVQNIFHIGTQTVGGAPPYALNGHIARIAYYSTRQPNATLQAITTT